MFNRGIRLPVRLLGIPLLLDWSFLIVLPLLAWMIGRRVGTLAQVFHIEPAGRLTIGLAPYWLGIIAALGLFASVVLHELGHAIAAQAYHVKVRSITLWFLGGIARFDELPREHGAEAIIAIVGPIVSFALAGLSWLLTTLPFADWPAWRFVLSYLASTNLVLGVFNLLPALPLDGGRVLRSLLAMALPYGRATQVAGSVSQVLAVLVGLLGFLSGNLFLLAIAIFVFFAVSAESNYVRFEETLRSVPVRALMNTHVSTIQPATRVADLPDLVWRERHTSFPVVREDGVVLGMVSLDDAWAHDPATPIGQIMHDATKLNENADAADALHAMSNNGMGGVVVTNPEGRLSGIVTKTDLIRALQIQGLTTSARRREVAL